LAGAFLPLRRKCGCTSADLLEKNTSPRYYVSFSHRYQHILHRNLIYLATIADATPPSTQKTVD
uniref:SS18 N-terminal domain-containing protein n=1 Tax=Buteo japonicus TaxID=224669 RepID=A0A8C0HNQ5_9AVES